MQPSLAAMRKRVPVSLTADDFAKLCHLFYRRTGIQFTEAKRYFVERRLEERLAETETLSFHDYFRLLRFQATGDEMQSLVNKLTVNETYFLREDYQFEALATGVLPELVADREKGSTVRVWSMPCSTGEEPYSIAIHLLENWAAADDFNIELLASDIDSHALAAAKRGLFSERSVHRLDAKLRQRYFAHHDAGQYEICDELRTSVTFTHANIIDPGDVQRYRGVDVIFCRNMLIYFDDLSRRKAIEHFFECLNPGGFIFLGHSESMSRISTIFETRRFGDVVVYQKPAWVE